MGCGPPTREPDNHEPRIARHGWQHEASFRVEQFFRARLMTHMADHEQALLRSQSGSMAGLAFSSGRSNSLIRIEPHFFRIIFLHRFHLLSPLRALVSLRPFPRFLWPQICVRESGGVGKTRICSQATRVCREAGAKIATKVMLCDLDLPVPVGFPLFGGAQLATDATFVFPLHCDRSARPGSAHTGTEQQWQSHVGGRNGPTQSWLVAVPGHGWSFWPEKSEVQLLAKAKARSEPLV